MIISKDKVVSLTYELRVDSSEGDIVEVLNEDSPLTFLYGSGRTPELLFLGNASGEPSGRRLTPATTGFRRDRACYLEYIGPTTSFLQDIEFAKNGRTTPTVP